MNDRRGSFAHTRADIVFASIFTLPLAAFIAFDVLVLGRVYGLEYNDAAAGGYGAGLDWLTFYAWPTPYHPAYLFHQSTALLVALAGVYTKDLSGFQAGVLTANVAVHFFAGLWSAGAARRLGLNLLDAAVFGALIVTMPAVLVFASQWTPYSWIAAIIAAFAIKLFELWLAGENPRGRWWSVGIGFGFLSGFYFPALAIALAVGVAVLARTALSSPPLVDRWLGFSDRPPSRGLIAVTYLAICAAGAAIGALYTYFTLYPAAMLYEYSWRQLGFSYLAAMGVAVFPTFAILSLEERLGRWGRLIPGAAGPVLIGWLIASNIMVPFWLAAADGALRARSGIVAPGQMFTFVSRFFEHYWDVLILLAIIALMGAAAGALRTRKWPVLLISFAALGVCLLSVLAAAREFLGETPIAIDPGKFGQAPRVLICVLFSIVIAYLLLRRAPLGHRIAVAAVMVFGIASLWQDITILAPATQRVRAAAGQINALTTDHLVKSDARLLCVRSRIPEECAMAYAFDHARFPPARAISPPAPIRGGAVCYVRTAPAGCEAAERMWREAGCTPRGGEILISQELAPNEASPPNTTLEGYFFGLRINMSVCSFSPQRQ